MEVIHKNIDLEQYTSRVPANIPPCREDLYCQFKNEIDGDWGMVPKTVRIPDNLKDKISEKTDNVLNIPVEGEADVYYPFEPYTEKFKSFCEEMHASYPDNKKWNKFYYIKDGKTYEHDFNSGSDTDVKYLSYNTLHKWFAFFHFYNESFLGGYGTKEFSSAQERWEWERATANLYNFRYQTDKCKEYDELYASRGGSDCMNWLFNDVFGFRKVVLHDWKDYYDLVPHYMFWGQIRQYKAWFTARVDKYKDKEWIDCKDEPDCCECREWFRRGGNDMYEWLLGQKEPDAIENICIDSVIDVSFLLTRKVSDLGFYVPLTDYFSSNQRYKEGDEVVYNEDSYRLVDENGSCVADVVLSGVGYSQKYKEKVFGDLNANEYDSETGEYVPYPEDKWVWLNINGEDMALNTGTTISGRTTSKLFDLRDLLISTDDMGNELHGFLNTYYCDIQVDSDGEETIFIQPDEGTILDLIYHKGNVCSLEKEYTMDDINDPDIKHEISWGNIIKSIRFFVKDWNGKEVPVKSGKESLFYGTNDSNLKALARCESEINYWNGQIVDGFETALEFDNTENALQDTVYCEVRYVIGGLVDRVHCSIGNNNFSYYVALEKDSPYNKYDYQVGVEYREVQQLDRKKEFYQTNEGTSILLHYYKFHFDMQNINTGSDFSYLEQTAEFTAHTYCIKSNGYNGLVKLRMIRREKDMNLSSPYIENSDIYIDRGTHRALDTMLKLQETRSLEALEQYGNGSIPISE